MKKTILSVFAFVLTISVNAQSEPRGLDLQATAPEFSAKDQDDKNIDLKEKLKNGPVVLVFYRGQWCPYCNKFLKQLEDSLSLVTAKGATIIAVTAEKPENIDITIEKTKATYPILYDEGLKIMKSYDVAYAVDNKTIEAYKKYGIDFTKVNGEANGTNLPVPAVYVINREGKIIFRHFDKNYTKRPPVKEILESLK